MFSDLSGIDAGIRYRCTAVTLGRINAYTLNSTPITYLDSPATTDAVSYSFTAIMILVVQEPFI